MDILINQLEHRPGFTYVEATCGSVSAFVSISKHSIQVCCQNASHRVWRNMGKCFQDFESAVENYRSLEMKSIIRTAEALVSDPLAIA